MKINWKYCVIALLFFSVTFLYYKENQENKKYENYLSQELQNRHNELIGNLFIVKDETTSFLNETLNPEMKRNIAERFYRISVLSQELNYFISNVQQEKNDLLKNQTSSVSSDLAWFFENQDLNSLSKEDRAKLTRINVISNEYKGVNRKNQTEIKKYNSNPFIKSEKWKSVMVGLDEVSREYKNAFSS
ncbi:hypothetical protein ACFO9Q_11045 [Paenibacillus sp. GCM10023252]|uniref:hypothetical protein n=1 Tax=Paenibacillus sp. GCM10023252 TaxID=3252649 RepID=UPI00360B4D75